MAKILSSRVVVLVITALAPLLYLIAQNHNFYDKSQIVASIMFIAGFCIILYGGGAIIGKWFLKNRPNSIFLVSICSFKVELCSLMISIVAFLILIFYYGIFIIKGCYQGNSLGNILLFTMFLFVFGLGYSAIRLRILGVFAFAFVGISFIRLFWGIAGDNRESNLLSALQKNSQQGINTVTLKTKPNIYLFLLESFQSRTVLNKVYGINSDSFITELTSEGYVIYDSVYSNYANTLFSATSIFQMDHSYYSGACGDADAIMSYRQLISGNKNNNVLNILKQNGYFIAYIQSSDILFKVNSINIDYTNLLFSELLSLRPIIDVNLLIKPALKSIFRMNKGFRNWVRNIVLRPSEKVMINRGKLTVIKDSTNVRDLMSYIKSSKNDKPTFRFIYWSGLGAEHPPNNVIHKKNTDGYASLWKDYYRDLIEQSETNILDVVKNINRQDPGAIVILIGDHGSWCKGMFVREQIDKCSSADELKKAVSQYGFTMQELATDITSVFCAIKWPDSSHKPQNRIFSHVNLFRYIFSALAKDTEIINNAKLNASYLLLGGLSGKGVVYEMARDAALREDWVGLEKNNR